MRKILMTGFTAKMVGSKRLKRDYVICGDLFKEFLLMIPGVLVDTRTVSLDEDLSSYDRIIVGISPLSSLGSVHADEALVTLDRYGHDKCVLYTDDWSVGGIPKDWSHTLNKDWGRYMRFRGYDEALTGPMRAAIADVLAGKFMILSFLFSWGHHCIFGLKEMDERIVRLDPSVLISGRCKKGKEVKQRRWVSATLSDHSSWLKRQRFSWDVLQVGQKKKNQPMLGEREVCQLYADNWGVISVGYKNAGSGWWRVRYNFCEQNDSVLFCDHEDGKQIGPSFTHDLRHIEGLTDDELRKLALEQKNTLMSQYEPMAHVVKKLKEALKL